jgi:asparagine synthetase B (glutamine-hydrolysing)
MATDSRFRMSQLELAGGIVFGTDPDTPPLRDAPPGLTARVALENVMLVALLRPPCVVSFSGGRDSSAVLALAAHVARREGLPLPVPVSLRFPQCEDANEDGWQELLVRHLRLQDWTRLCFDHELDAVGPYAQAVLAQHGLLWPSNAHFHLPIVEQAPGGSLLTGFGGDELLHPGGVWHRVNQVLSGRLPLRRRDLARIAVAYGPAPLRRVALRRVVLRRRLRHVSQRPWLRPDALRRVVEATLDDLVAEPVRWDVGVDVAWWRQRYRRVIEDSLARVGQMHRVTVRHPLTDGLFLAAVAHEAGRAGFVDRTVAMERLAGDLLPAEITARPTKAVLTGAFWNRHAIAFAASWDGTGVNAELVDIDALLRMWKASDQLPDARTFSLLQSAWLARRRRETGQAN